MERNYYTVRAMASSEQEFRIFFENSVVAVGWSDVPFNKYPIDQTEQLVDEVQDCYYASGNAHLPTVSKKLNEVRRFHNIKNGDYIIIPFYDSIRLAIADDGILFDDGAKALDLGNQRKVRYVFSNGAIKTIPRDVLSEALQRRLRVRGSTVSDLYEFKDEIEKFFNQETYTWTSNFEENETKLKESFKSRLMSKIKSGNTNLKTGGIGLEHLVKELLQCEGYIAKVLPKTTFQSGDADVSAIKSDKFQETKLLVQVKHHSGYTNEWGLQQLADIKKSPDHDDHKYILVTSADISEKVRAIAEEQSIIIVDGGELSGWILENLSKLSPDVKIKLGVSSVPQFSE